MKTTPLAQASIVDTINAHLPWSYLEIPNYDAIPVGDMPDDKVIIRTEHVQKANLIIGELLKMLLPILKANQNERAVVAICGGSGVGKSETASVLSFFLNEMGVGAYILSGDNYPVRNPEQNDMERVRIFQNAGIQGLIACGCYEGETKSILVALQKSGEDADSTAAEMYPWMKVYQAAGDYALRNYLGTPNEIDFRELNNIIAKFKTGANHILLKRMGRKASSAWYDLVDFSKKRIVVLEWTHSNSNFLYGVDIPVFLYSTQQETKAYRLERNRDKGIDSHFTNRALRLEGELLLTQAAKAKLIVSKDGKLMTLMELMGIKAAK